jgi:hypothetical protein
MALAMGLGFKRRFLLLDRLHIPAAIVGGLVFVFPRQAGGVYGQRLSGDRRIVGRCHLARRGVPDCALPRPRAQEREQHRRRNQ